MDVFAEFVKKDGVEYRQKTLLKFGESSQLIGSIVLMNPGSAKPTNKLINNDFVADFYESTHQYKLENPSEWHRFSVDQTMLRIERIFNGWYLGLEKQLDGVIQLFNCYYFRDPNLENAIKNFRNSDNCSQFVFNEINFFSEKPVYFGWGNEGKNGAFKCVAERIFANYDKSLTPIYNDNFDDNCFYHPSYINRSYKRNLASQDILTKFHNIVFKI
ncbi:hypothetical protein SAMN05660477_01797 [Soonwooa buanensis]|uniref:Uracil DNA glycosylase superfamily protein n=1 Tax=Soonwooa buanensis TaxID=619805 RepID=A0A1T5F5L2_9FLAO|nr:hypothetical protein [Soonwooa buanensis]SKB91308.1 hypothetical protein SAMN05660477_01797 [Soonwooa buanensis]